MTLALVVTACAASPAPRTTPEGGEGYRVCDADAACGARGECVLGLCQPRCGEGPACREAEACWDGECRAACDDAHACRPGYRCGAPGDDGARACAYDPCGNLALFPLSLRSASLPILVHYRDAIEASAAREALAATEEAWRVETGAMGWDPPVSDGGRCGPDGALDVFVWRTFRGCVSDVVGEVPETPHDDRANHLIVDPWGPYGGEHLRATVAHELSHALQAAHDWNEVPIAFEMGAQFVESLFAPDEPTWVSYFDDYQSHADWAFDHDDGYETWFMYGSALYLHFLRERVMPEPMRDRFLAEVWRRCRSVAGENEPDYLDALASVLEEHAGISLEESLARFARARYYTGARHDGHFSFGARMGDGASVPVRDLDETGSLEPVEGPELLGVHYVRVRGAGESVRVTLRGDSQVRFRVEAIPGRGSEGDGETLAVDAGDLEVPLVAGERVLAILALPRDDAAWDPDSRPRGRVRYRLERRP